MLPALLRANPNFRRYFVGQSVSLVGDQVTAIALPLTAVLALHASAGRMGALTTAYLVPNLLFSLHAGAWIDWRGGRRAAMIAADAGRALLIASIPLAYALGGLTWAQLYAVAFLTGTLGPPPRPPPGDARGRARCRVGRRDRRLTDHRARRVPDRGRVVLGCLFASEFLSGLGVMLLDIMAGTSSAGIVPTALRSRVSGAFMLVNYGTRPLGTSVAGVLGTAIGLRPTMWIATVGGLAGLVFLVPSPLRTLEHVPEQAG